MKRQTIFSLFVINLAAFLLVLIIGVEEKESNLIEVGHELLREENIEPAAGGILKNEIILSKVRAPNGTAVMQSPLISVDSLVSIEMRW